MRPEDRLINPPLAKTWGYFAAEKVDHEYARNFLLWFVHERGLDDELLAYIKEHMPKDEE